MMFEHKSVLLYETIDSLNVKPDGIYVDGTLGGGGHALEVCRRLGEYGRLIGIDQDADAIAAASERLRDYEDRVTIVRSNYEEIQSVLKDLGIEKADGIYLDDPGILLSAGHTGTGIHLPGGRRSAGYEDGSEKHTDGRRYCEYVQRV